MVILATDKGLARVLMDKEEYIKKTEVTVKLTNIQDDPY